MNKLYTGKSMKQIYVSTIAMLITLSAHSASKSAEQVEKQKQATSIPAQEKKKSDTKKVDKSTFHPKFPPPPPGTIYHTYHCPQRKKKD